MLPIGNTVNDFGGTTKSYKLIPFSDHLFLRDQSVRGHSVWGHSVRDHSVRDHSVRDLSVR